MTLRGCVAIFSKLNAFPSCFGCYAGHFFRASGVRHLFSVLYRRVVRLHTRSGPQAA